MGNDRKQDPEKKAADGWPAWMGDADPSLAPKPPPKAKPAAQPALARTAKPVLQRQAPLAAAPPPPPVASPPRRGLRAFACGFAIALALVAGDVAARFRPEIALGFQHSVAKALDRVPASIPLGPIAAGAAGVLVLILVWQAGRHRRPLFLPIALVLCLVSSSVGFYRGGHDIDLASLRGELGILRQKLESAQADREKASRSLQKSSMTIQEQDEALSALRKEIEELRKKLAEKN